MGIRGREICQCHPEAASAVSGEEDTSQRQEGTGEDRGRTEAEGATREEGIMATALLIAHMSLTRALPGMSIEETGEASMPHPSAVMGLAQRAVVQLRLDTVQRACHPGHHNLCLGQVLRVTL